LKSNKIVFQVLNADYTNLLLEYYSDNKDHLEIWHPTTPKDFYTFKYQKSKVEERIHLMSKRESMHILMLDKAQTKMIGHCNYTKIKDGRCWLGYSIAKEFEGKGLMYEAIKQTANFMFNNYAITEIRAGILPHNHRSKKLVERLDFKYIDEPDKLEINGKLWTYDTYLLSL